ncbi:MAG: type II toxin-antitoxin system VapC family toxin [Spirochaetota bacterium]
MILLDTCGLLWLVSGSGDLSASALGQIDSEPIVSVSAISALEIGLRVRSGKLELPMPVGDWWEQAVAHHRLDVVAPDATILIRSTELPPIHRDPADRIIIATALERRAAVVTSDRRFAEYGIETMR